MLKYPCIILHKYIISHDYQNYAGTFVALRIIIVILLWDKKYIGMICFACK